MEISPGTKVSRYISGSRKTETTLKVDIRKFSEKLYSLLFRLNTKALKK
ncbi:MAG: hypothetical protein CM1200mP5_6720 [Candidatus Pelagibacterales bacterium]|nr:MAG: hypothetical protein CM1200mP5_6720 [Pelagibacterales bacterium]